MNRLWMPAWAAAALAVSCVAVPPPATDLPDSPASASAEEAPWDPEFRYLEVEAEVETEASDPAMDGAMEHGDGSMQHEPPAKSVDHDQHGGPSGSEPRAPPLGQGDVHETHAMEPHHVSPLVEDTAELSYFCPMHPEAVREDSGACPICGMTLEPQPHPAREGYGR